MPWAWGEATSSTSLGDALEGSLQGGRGLGEQVGAEACEVDDLGGAADAGAGADLVGGAQGGVVHG